MNAIERNSSDKSQTRLGCLKRLRLTILGVLSLFFLNTPVNAQYLNAFDRISDSMNTLGEDIAEWIGNDMRAMGWQVEVGVGVGLAPDYTGSNNYRFLALPLVDIKYKDRFHLQGTRLTANLLNGEHWRLGPLINYRFGRDEARNSALKGLGDINNTFEIGGFVQYRTKMMRIEGDIRVATANGQGAIINMLIAHGLYGDEQNQLAVGIRGRWLSDGAMQARFGITAEQARNSPLNLDEYTPHDGLSEISLNMLGRHDIGPHWRLTGLISLGRLVGNAKDSPLVDGPLSNNLATSMGAPTQILFGTALQYRF